MKIKNIVRVDAKKFKAATKKRGLKYVTMCRELSLCDVYLSQAIGRGWIPQRVAKMLEIKWNIKPEEYEAEEPKQEEPNPTEAPSSDSVATMTKAELAEMIRREVEAGIVAYKTRLAAKVWRA